MFYSFTLFGKEIPMYAVCLYIGVAVAAFVATRLAKKKDDISSFDVIGSAVYTMIGAMLGAKLLFIAVSWEDIFATIAEQNYGFLDATLFVLKGGFVFYGGFIGGILGLLIYVLQFRRNLIDYFNLYAVVLPLGHAFGRIGCFCGGCCYGMEHDGFLSVDFPVYPGYENSPVVSRLPVQLFEAAGLVVIFAVLIFVFYRYPKKRALSLWLYLFTYPVLRFALEFLRGDEARGGLWLFSTSQWISLLILAVVLTAFIITKKRQKEPLSTDTTE